MKKIVIAIDGFSSCGKSTMAKDLAREIGYIYIDSGAMYRAVALYCIQHDLFFPDGSVKAEELEQQLNNIHISFQLDASTGKPRTCLNGTDIEDRIRTLEVSSHVSQVAALGFVRHALVKQQQDMEDIRNGIGRDTSPASLRRIKGQRTRRAIRRDSEERRRTRPYRPESCSKSAA